MAGVIAASANAQMALPGVVFSDLTLQSKHVNSGTSGHITNNTSATTQRNTATGSGGSRWYDYVDEICPSLSRETRLNFSRLEFHHSRL